MANCLTCPLGLLGTKQPIDLMHWGSLLIVTRRLKGIVANAASDLPLCSPACLALVWACLKWAAAVTVRRRPLTPRWLA